MGKAQKNEIGAFGMSNSNGSQGKLSAAAVIDIGSSDIRMKIAQNHKGKYTEIESLTQPATLGRDTFGMGRIGFSAAEKCCETLKNYIKAASEYGVSQIKVIATSSIREAKNRDYILDQIRLKTGHNVTVLDPQEEKYLVYRQIVQELPKNYKSSSLLAHIGSGDFGVAVLENENITYTQDLKLGSLRINEMFEGLSEYSKGYHQVVREYLESHTGGLVRFLPQQGIANFVAVGRDIVTIAKLCGAERPAGYFKIDKQRFNALFDEIKGKSPEMIASYYHLPEEQSGLLLPAMCIYGHLLGLTKADALLTADFRLDDCVMSELLFPSESEETDKSLEESAIISAKKIAERFWSDGVHTKSLELFSMRIFDKMKKKFRLSSRERLLLRIAIILHDCGAFVNAKSSYRSTHAIISRLEIIGLSLIETELIASIAFYHNRDISDFNSGPYIYLSPEEKVMVSKLAAIMRLADSLNRSHAQKFSDIEVKLGDEGLVITIASQKNTELEQWSFMEKKEFYEEVFGISASLKVRNIEG